MKSDRGTCCKKNEERFEKLSEDQKLSRLCSEASLRLVQVGQFFNALPSPRGKANQSLCREYTMPRDQEGTCFKGWIQSNVRFGPVSDTKVCNHNGRYSIEVQVPSLFHDYTVSWIRIVNGTDKFVREAMPIQEVEKASWKPAAKAETNIKTVILLWNRENGLTMKYRNPKLLIVFKCQNSSLDYFDTVNKLIERMMEESIKTKLLMNARKKLSDDTGSDAASRQYSALVSRRIDISSGKRWRTEEKVSILRQPELFSEIPVLSNNPKDIQEVQSILHCKTLCCYQKVLPILLTRRKRERLEVNSESWFDSRRSQSQKQADMLCSSLL